MLRSSDQLHEVVTLACELLPPLPDAAAVMLAGLPAAPHTPSGESTYSAALFKKATRAKAKKWAGHQHADLVPIQTSGSLTSGGA